MTKFVKTVPTNLDFDPAIFLDKFTGSENIDIYPLISAYNGADYRLSGPRRTDKLARKCGPGNPVHPMVSAHFLFP